MDTRSRLTTEFDFDKFRPRRFVERLIDLDEVETHEQPVALTGPGAARRRRS